MADATESAAYEILKAHVPPLAIEKFERARCSIRVLREGERYAHASGELSRLQIDVDRWPVPPAGLFVVAERTIYLRKVSTMTTVHEFGHALDCALGGGVYHSGINATIRADFMAARAFVTPYAACGLDEYFAECFRAWCGANDPDGPWPVVTRKLLARKSPVMSAFFDALFAPTGEQMPLV